MKEWYLTTPVPNITGFESDVISGYAQSNFTDILLTEFADSAILYNADLSIGTNIRCVIEGNTAETQLKSMERIILAPIGTLHSGNYIYFDDNYWIVDGMPGNNKSYEKATLKICQYKLRWQKDDLSIVERWCNLTSASKYDVGENGNNVIILSSNNYTILIPHDDDGQTLEEKRVFIDTSNNPHKVFKITRNDDPLFLYGSKGGVLSLIADKTELNTETDRPDLRLCDYKGPHSPTPPIEPNETSVLCATISGKEQLRLDYKKKYTVSFTDKGTGETVEWSGVDFKWNVVSNFIVKQDIYDNVIELLVNDEDSVGSSFLLQCLVQDVVVGQMEISVIDGW